MNNQQKGTLAAAATFMFTAVYAIVNAQVPIDNSPIEPTIPDANRDNINQVFLEHADRLVSTSAEDYQVLVGNVEFRRGGMFMYCDSAHFYDGSGNFNAYGNVKMRQGDTLFIDGDVLEYDDIRQLATLYGDNGDAVLRNRDVTLRTPVFNYDLEAELGYFDVGGVLTDKQNRLRATEGEYSPSTKEATFRDGVRLTSLSEKDTLQISTDHLYYNTATHIAEISTYSVITNRDGIIYTTNGSYNTETTQADLYDNSLVVTTNGNTLSGDTIYYNKEAGRGEVFGNMELTDTVNKVRLRGQYGFYNELTDSIFVTGGPLVTDYSQKDTLYLHADTIRGYRHLTDSTAATQADTIRYLVAAPRVKFYRTDIQGLCDSLTFISKDTMIYLDRFPVIWSDNRQITGDIITLHLNDSTLDWAKIPQKAFMTEEIEEGYYNQLSGNTMYATFTDGTIRSLDVSGNVQAITFPEENDSTINKMLNLVSSFLSATFKDNTIEKMNLWSETNAVVTPLYLAKKSSMFLPDFNWYGQYRPTCPADIFRFSDELLQHFANAPLYIWPEEDNEDSDQDPEPLAATTLSPAIITNATPHENEKDSTPPISD